MEEFLEDYDNPILQVFAEFATFLYVVRYDCKTNKMLHNIMLESKKIHIRALCEFFSNTKEYKDDLIYRDFIITDKDLSVPISDELRRFINKSLAHISKKRGRQKFPEGEFIKVQMDLIKSISRFMSEIDRNIKLEYRKYLIDSQVQDVLTGILKSIIVISELHAQKGVLIEL